MLTTPSNVLPLHLKQTFPAIIWIFFEGEGDKIKSRLPFKMFSTLLDVDVDSDSISLQILLEKNILIWQIQEVHTFFMIDWSHGELIQFISLSATWIEKLVTNIWWMSIGLVLLWTFESWHVSANSTHVLLTFFPN